MLGFWVRQLILWVARRVTRVAVVCAYPNTRCLSRLVFDGSSYAARPLEPARRRSARRLAHAHTPAPALPAVLTRLAFACATPTHAASTAPALPP